MSVRIQFDQPQARCYTNLDFVSGRVILVLLQDATISAINVKLEAESRTRLAGPKQPHNERSEKKRTELEVHKLLYKVLTVFPTPEVQDSLSNSQYTLLAGHYEYPFRFKFPFNNDCSRNTSLLRDLKVGQLNVQFAPDINKHVRKALPPSLSGFPGEAEIKYYLKVTVVRPKFYQENLRNQVDIKFMPIEPPRPPNRHEETFARRKQQFQKSAVEVEKKGLFKKSSIPDPADEEPPAFQVDARLPNPAVITCNEPLPLRVLVSRINNSTANVFLSMFQVELIGYTRVRAHDLNRTESGSWVLMSQANMNMPLNSPTDKPQMEWKLPSRLWENIPLPNTVAPSFDTCNISRKYELEVRVGLAHGTSSGVRPELIVLPLRIPVQVFSGITPPPELLRAFALQRQQHADRPSLFPKPPEVNTQSTGSSEVPNTPTQEQSPLTPQAGSSEPLPDPDIPDDAPPSYEDAMADDIGPVDGPRREYNVPADPEQQPPAFNNDTKGGGLGRRVSERLFSQNAPARPQRTGRQLSQSSPVDEERQGFQSRRSLEEADAPPPPLPERTPTYRE